MNRSGGAGRPENFDRLGRVEAFGELHGLTDHFGDWARLKGGQLPHAACFLSFLKYVQDVGRGVLAVRARQLLAAAEGGCAH